MCDKARYAGTVDLKVSALRKLGLENPEYFSPEWLEEMTGINPLEE